MRTWALLARENLPRRSYILSLRRNDIARYAMATAEEVIVGAAVAA